MKVQYYFTASLFAGVDLLVDFHLYLFEYNNKSRKYLVKQIKISFYQQKNKEKTGKRIMALLYIYLDTIFFKEEDEDDVVLSFAT